MSADSQHTTRQRIVKESAELIHNKGYNHTGLQEILAAADVPKGSFYYHFKSKEDLGLAVIEYFEQGYTGLVTDLMAPSSTPPLDRLHRFFEIFRERAKFFEYTRGCPIGNLAQEMGDLNEVFRERLDKTIDNMAAPLIPLLAEAQQRGDIAADLDPADTAYFIISAWHGALVRMKVAKNAKPLELFERMLFDRILN